MKPARQQLLVGGIILALGLLAGVTWAAWQQFERVDAASALVSHTEQVLNRQSRLLSVVQDVETGARGFVLTGNPAFLEPYETGRTRVAGELEALCALVEDNPRQRASCAEVAPLVRQRVAAADHSVTLRQTEGFDAARTAVASGSGKAAMDQIRALIARMESDERAVLNERTAEANAAARTSYLRMTISIGVAFLLFTAAFAVVVYENDLRRRSESALRASEARYRQLFTSIDEGFCIIEVMFDAQQRPVDYRFLELNPAFERQTGLHDAVGKRMREIAPNHEEHWFEIYGRIALTGEPARFQNEARELHRWYDVYAFQFGEPRLRQVAILFNDITERKATEGEIAQLNTNLQRQAAELEDANRELESFSYSVSHDLRAPLRSIDGFSQVLQEDCADQLNDEGKDALKRVRRAAITMGELIDALLALSRVSRVELRSERVDLSAMANAIAGELRESQPGRKVEFVIAPDLILEADSRLFRAMLGNLLGNAWKYTGQRATARIELGRMEGDDGPVYFVRDNGVGFDMAYVGKLFGAFQRLHRQAEYAGTGVGLATVQRILHRHGGRAWAEAVPNEGATFYFTVGRSRSSRSGERTHL